MNIKQQANEVVNRFEEKFETKYSEKIRTELVHMLVGLANEFPASRPDNGAALIMMERGRQIKEEGWSSSHDDLHTKGELVQAAIAYAYIGSDFNLASNKSILIEIIWPWDAKFWKPKKNRIRNLVRAGALIAAEIDRLQRLEIASGK